MQNYHKIIIIGAGPIGLYFASKCESKHLDYFVLEGSGEIGGQITHLYPEKEVVDLKGIQSIKAKDYISLLASKIDLSRVSLNSQVISIKPGKNIEIATKNGVFACENLVIATGLGTSTPRPLGVENEDKATNIIYNLKEIDFLKNKRIAIFGGGDSALDWAKTLSSISNDVHLIHRRTEFRGNPETIKDCKNLKVHLPYIPNSISLNKDIATAVTIKKVDSEELLSIDVDYIFVNYGNIAQQSSFPFEMEGAFLKVNDSLEVAPKIFAIGDVASYQNKTRRMAPGNIEADRVFEEITY